MDVCRHCERVCGDSFGTVNGANKYLTLLSVNFWTAKKGRECAVHGGWTQTVLCNSTSYIVCTHTYMNNIYSVWRFCLVLCMCVSCCPPKRWWCVRITTACCTILLSMFSYCALLFQPTTYLLCMVLSDWHLLVGSVSTYTFPSVQKYTELYRPKWIIPFV